MADKVKKCAFFDKNGRHFDKNENSKKQKKIVSQYFLCKFTERLDYLKKR